MKIRPTYVDDERKKLNSKLRFGYNLSDSTITTEDSLLTIKLLPTERKNLSKLRINDSYHYFILKKENEFFTIPEEILESIDDIFMNENAHLCPDCDNFFNCQKVLDRELNINTKFNKKKYLYSKRIEKYNFITLGCEMHNHFLVWKCSDFFNSTHHDKDKTNEEDDDDIDVYDEEELDYDTTYYKNLEEKNFRSIVRSISP